MAHLDPLTRLPNRILLMGRLDQALAISQRNHLRAGVIFLDLDNFKDINDRLDHHVGDQVLQLIAVRIRESIREVDTVSRLGGDEFIIVLPELHDMADADVIARKDDRRRRNGMHRRGTEGPDHPQPGDQHFPRPRTRWRHADPPRRPGRVSRITVGTQYPRRIPAGPGGVMVLKM